MVLCRLTKGFAAVYERFIPNAAEKRPEDLRRARLIVAFSLQGAIFGSLFGAFYFLIGHYWGGAIVAACSTLFALVPFLLRGGAPTERAGNYYCFILLAGFLSLCWVEGGINGHALAWLMIVPLCALLLTSRRGAYGWSAAAFAAALFTAGVETFGVSPPIRYPMEWHFIVSTMGYSALVAFLFALGLIFENGRKTAHDQMEATLSELAKANKNLTRLNAEKSEFLSIAAHDLKSPLTVVMGRAEMIKFPNYTAAQREFAVDTILKEAKRMRGLISDLLDLNAIEEGRMNVNITSVRVADAVDQLCEGHRANAATKQIVLNVDTDKDLMAFVDEKGLLQILDNLLSNAIKFTNKGGSVSVKTWADRDHAWIKITDTGPGLSTEDQSKLFGRFTRLSNRPTGGESSHGLGLSIVKRLVDTMKGDIKCESAVGKGTSFILNFPRPAPPTEPSNNDSRMRTFQRTFSPDKSRFGASQI